MGCDGFFSRLYILLCILSRNAFGHVGLGKCKLVILRCRFHCKNAGFEDLTIGILHFWFLGFPGNFWYYMGFDWFFLGCTFCWAFFPEFPGNPRKQKCKIPVVRSSKPAFFAVKPGPQYHQLIRYHIISYYIILYHIIAYYIVVPPKGRGVGKKCKLHFLFPPPFP